MRFSGASRLVQKNIALVSDRQTFYNANCIEWLGGLKKKIGDKQKEFSDFRQFVVGYKKKKIPNFRKSRKLRSPNQTTPIVTKNVCMQIMLFKYIIRKILLNKKQKQAQLHYNCISNAEFS